MTEQSNTDTPKYYPAKQWVINESKEIWLHCLRHIKSWVYNRDGDGYIEEGWQFYWKGNLIYLETKKPTGSDWYIKIHKLDIPEKIQEYKLKILEDIKSAFLAYKTDENFYKIKIISIEFNLPV